jgi:C4-dicarboxylate transporter DctM subunit
MILPVFAIVFFILIFLGVPIGITFVSVSLLPSIMQPGYPFNVEMVVKAVMAGLDSFPLLAIPLFILSGNIMAVGGVSAAIFEFFAYFLGNKRAGYPCAVIATCLFYGAISGSAPATTAAVGAMSIPILEKLGYDKVFITALVAIAGGLGVIIPPSIPFIIYASVADASTSELFLAGILPGFLIASLLMAYAWYHCGKEGEDRQKLEENYQKIRSIGLLPLIKKSIWALITPIIILGSIYGGIASPTEAAAMSVFYALFVSIVVYKSIQIKDLYKIFAGAVRTYGSLLFIIGGAVAMARVLTMLQAPQVIGATMMDLASTKVALIGLTIIMLLIVGMFMDTIPSLLIFTPIFLPVMISVGVDPIHFGVIIVISLAVGLVTPPMGINLFVASSITNIPIISIARKAVPLIVAFCIALVIIAYVPAIPLAFLSR